MQDYLSSAKDQQVSIYIEGLEFNPNTRVLSCDEQVIDLEPRSIELLELFLTSVGQPLAAEHIIESVWQSNFISKNVLTNRISTLRSVLQKYLPDSDATKILVTYPRKGYFLNPSSISFATGSPDTAADDAVIEPPTSKKGDGSNPVNPWLVVVSLALLISTAVMGYMLWQSSTRASEVERDQRLIPKVELLLNRLDAIGDNSRKYRKVVKALLLQQQIEYAYTDLANQDAPSYFLDPIDSSPFFPGAKNMRTSDYLLNIQLKDQEVDKRLIAKISLIYPNSGKLAFGGVYSIDVNNISSSIMEINRELANYFALPAPLSPEWSVDNIEISELLSGKTITFDGIKLNTMNSTLIARQLALFETDQKKLIAFTNLVQTQFKLLPDELKLWLGIIHFKLRDLQTAKEFLTNTSGNSTIENALVYMMISHIAYKQGNMEKFRLNYMESLVALLRVVPSEDLFARLSKPESKSTCLQPWKSLKLSVKEPLIIKQWESLMLNYCTAVGQQISGQNKKPFKINNLNIN
ncbi:winged helix-turn-helix domain-containing protein [Vibrio lentus]|uniref:winged helix-turn-helix domain-containing protein n=1 Tax=Vibrio lentus TaxID=136468 RepID=UPI000C85FB11|nr:winged helix-turn-helix domain-containing protein [Vibrio lentus]PMJ86761.1 transcriptional regulator [Vibrio lentus]PMN41377.1 transcriptional regulator [Vibrio lentus]PMN60197.1 transcriptional regulator [Vibrio lentus]